MQKWPISSQKWPISSQKSPISSQNGHSGAKTGKVSDWYQSDNYLWAIGQQDSAIVCIETMTILNFVNNFTNFINIYHYAHTLYTITSSAGSEGSASSAPIGPVVAHVGRVAHNLGPCAAGGEGRHRPRRCSQDNMYWQHSHERGTSVHWIPLHGLRQG